MGFLSRFSAVCGVPVRDDLLRPINPLVAVLGTGGTAFVLVSVLAIAQGLSAATARGYANTALVVSRDASVELSSAKLMLDERGATLSALVQASLHPRYSLSGQAQLSGSFTPGEWSLNLCGGVMADLVLVSAEATVCLDLNASGARSCDKPVPG